MNTSPLPPTNAELDRRVTALEIRFDTILPTLATKADVQELRGEMTGMRGEMTGMRGELRGEMSAMRGELLGEIHKLRADLFEALNGHFKWFLGFFATLVIGFAGLNYTLWYAVERHIESSFRALVLVQTRGVSPAPPVNAPAPKVEPGGK